MTVPSAAAWTGVPVAAAMSMPECGARDSLLKTRRRPKELVRTPSIGAAQTQRGRRMVGEGGQRLVQVRRFALVARLILRRQVHL